MSRAQSLCGYRILAYQYSFDRLRDFSSDVAVPHTSRAYNTSDSEKIGIAHFVRRRVLAPRSVFNCKQTSCLSIATLSLSEHTWRSS